MRLLITTLILLLSSSMNAFADNLIKSPNVAGAFYDNDPKELSSQINQFLAQAKVEPLQQFIPLIIAPHAGYYYSGQVAAFSFKVASQNNYKTIIILAASHHFPFQGVSIWQAGGYQTPLGIVAVDEDIAQAILGASDDFQYMPKVFEKEHSLEVELPFVQTVFPAAKIVPIIFGQPSFEIVDEFAQTLKSIIGDRKDVLVVVSSDMSHFHKDMPARMMDKKTMSLVEKMDVEALWNGNVTKEIELCGYVPVTAGLLYAKYQGWNDIDILKYANSGDVSGDKNRVVGYMSVIVKSGIPLIENSSQLNEEQKKFLMDVAKKAIDLYVREGKIYEPKVTDKRLLEEEGAFVTIHKKGQLRGCIGNIIGRGPLLKTIRDMAIAAATKDPRFPALTVKELDQIDIEISVLTKPHQVKNVDEIIMGKHGVIVSKGMFNSGVFLPQVATETGWSKEVFLSELCHQKAGLRADAWKDPSVKLEVFEALVFSENDLNH